MADSAHAEAPAAEQEMKPVTEPVGEEAVKASEDAALVSIGATVYTAISFATLVLFVLGAIVPWIHNDTASGSTDVSLWQARMTSSTGAVTTMKVLDDTCETRRQYFRAAESFAIISIFVALGAFLFGIAAKARGTSIKVGGAVLAFAALATSLITWGIGVRIYYLSFCGGTSFRDQFFYIRAGAALFITAFVLSFVNIIIAVRDVKVPKVIPDAAVDRFLAIVFTLFTAAAFVFTVIGTPVTVFSYVDPTTSIETRQTIWTAYTYDAGNNQLSSVSQRDVACGKWADYIRFSEAFSIISIGATLIALIVGIVATTGALGKRALLLAGLFAGLATLIKFAADLSLFYRQFCGAASLDSQQYHLGAGFALFVTASMAEFFVVILIAVAAVAQCVSSPAPEGNTRFSAFLFLFGTVVSITFMVIALTQPVFVQSSGDDYIQVTYWNVRQRSSGVYSESDFTCQDMWQRLVGGGALGVIAIGLSLVAAFLGVAQLSSGSLRKAASFAGLFLSVEQLTAWALAVTVYWGSFCGYTPYNSNFDLSSGTGLMIAAWALNVVVSVLNLVIA